MENEPAILIVRYKRKAFLRLALYALTAVAGVALLGWWFASFRTGIFDFYQAYIVGMGLGLFVFGAGSIVRELLVLKNNEKLLSAANVKANRRSDRDNNRAMASAFKIYLGAMVIALIFIGQMISYTSFVVCMFSVVFAYLCYVICSLAQRRKSK